MEQKTLEDGFFWLNIAQYGLATFLHCTGMVVLSKYPKQTNSNVILFYLSLTEVNLVIPGVTLRIHLDKVPYLGVTAKAILYVVEYTAIFQLVFMMYILTADRLICSINPLKYRYRVTKKRLRFAIAFTATFSFIAALTREIPYYILDSKEYSVIYYSIYYFFLIAGSGFVLLAIVTYTFIFRAARRSRTIARSNRTSGIRKKRKFLISGMIIFTFLFLYVLPYMFHAKDYFNLDKFQRFLLDETCRSLMLIGLMADPVVYIFLSKHYRNILLEKMKDICPYGKPESDQNDRQGVRVNDMIHEKKNDQCVAVNNGFEKENTEIEEELKSSDNLEKGTEIKKSEDCRFNENEDGFNRGYSDETLTDDKPNVISNSDNFVVNEDGYGNIGEETNNKSGESKYIGKNNGIVISAPNELMLESTRKISHV